MPFCRLPVFGATARALGQPQPLLWQTMYIFKQPRIGGEVRWHQDATYLITEPPAVIAFWVAVDDARTLTVTPWDRTMVQAIEKAIMTSDLGLNPATSGTVIRVPMPALTEQRRKEMIKVVHKEGEAAKVAVRNIRRDSNGELKNLFKAKTISEDDERGAEETIQKLTDKYIAEIDKVVEAKEKYMMEI